MILEFLERLTDSVGGKSMYCVILWLVVTLFFTGISILSGYRTKEEWDKFRGKEINQSKPQLLIQVRNFPQKVVQDRINNKQVHVTQIFYQNSSPLPMNDCTFILEILTPSQRFDLSGLFSSKMYIAAGDSRERNFVTKDEFLKRGFDLDKAVSSNEEVILSISYTFTLNNKTEKVKIQDYLWNSAQQRWDIR